MKGIMEVFVLEDAPSLAVLHHCGKLLALDDLKRCGIRRRWLRPVRLRSTFEAAGRLDDPNGPGVVTLHVPALHMVAMAVRLSYLRPRWTAQTARNKTLDLFRGDSFATDALRAGAAAALCRAEPGEHAYFRACAERQAQ